MDRGTEVLIGMAVMGLAALGAFACYRWRQRVRVRRVEAWVRSYLFVRDGEQPDHLHVNCSDDRHWPVLADFADRRTGTRHYLHFSCSGPESTFSLLSEREEKR